MSRIQERATHMQHQPIAIAGLIVVLIGMLTFGAPQASAQTTCLPLPKGFWKNNASAWPVTPLTLGSATYTQAQLLTILGMPASGDASVILADQLIGALLNIANGTDSSPVAATIADANTLLGGGAHS